MGITISIYRHYREVQILLVNMFVSMLYTMCRVSLIVHLTSMCANLICFSIMQIGYTIQCNTVFDCRCPMINNMVPCLHVYSTVFRHRWADTHCGQSWCDRNDLHRLHDIVSHVLPRSLCVVEVVGAIRQSDIDNQRPSDRVTTSVEWDVELHSAHYPMHQLSVNAFGQLPLLWYIWSSTLKRVYCMFILLVRVCLSGFLINCVSLPDQNYTTCTVQLYS